MEFGSRCFNPFQIFRIILTGEKNYTNRSFVTEEANLTCSFGRNITRSWSTFKNHLYKYICCERIILYRVLWAVCNSELDPELIYATGGARFKLKGHIISKVSDSADNSKITYELSLLDVKVGVWFAACAKIIIETIFFSDIINSEIYSVQILASGFVTLCDVETECEAF